MSVAEFTRNALNIVIDTVIQQNPHILFEDFPAQAADAARQSSQLSLFKDESSLPALVKEAKASKLKSTATKRAKTRSVG